MKQRAVIIDIDDTIADTQVELLRRINARSDRQYTYEELDHTFREGNQPEYEAHMQAVLSDPDHALTITPYSSALHSLARLHTQGYVLHLVTARGVEMAPVTRRWLGRHGFTNLIYRVHYRPKDMTGRDFKRSVAATVKAIAAFDDTYDVGAELAQQGTYVYLIDKPWNSQLPLRPQMERTPSFASGVERFLAPN